MRGQGRALGVGSGPRCGRGCRCCRRPGRRGRRGSRRPCPAAASARCWGPTCRRTRVTPDRTLGLCETIPFNSIPRVALATLEPLELSTHRHATSSRSGYSSPSSSCGPFLSAAARIARQAARGARGNKAGQRRGRKQLKERVNIKKKRKKSNDHRPSLRSSPRRRRRGRRASGRGSASSSGAGGRAGRGGSAGGGGGGGSDGGGAGPRGGGGRTWGRQAESQVSNCGWPLGRSGHLCSFVTVVTCAARAARAARQVRRSHRTGGSVEPSVGRRPACWTKAHRFPGVESGSPISGLPSIINRMGQLMNRILREPRRLAARGAPPRRPPARPPSRRRCSGRARPSRRSDCGERA
jgi:hypothetical protein